MTRFLDGPLGGITLNLKRAPLFLRATVDQSGNSDALDQLSDEMLIDEFGWVYIKHATSRGIACSRGQGCQSFEQHDYRLYETQPDQSILRDNELWREWTIAEHERRST